MSLENERLEPEEEVIESTDSQTDTETPSQEAWEAALQKTVAERDEYLALAQRTQADFQNFKRRNASIRTDGYDDGVRETLSGLLPMLDAFDMALKTARDQGAEGALLEGLELIYKQFEETLTKLGLEEVKSLGEAFDPEVHNAVMRESSGEPGTILEVFQKGYRVKGRILRYAMVKVAVE